ncbi:MAG: tryptophan synthase subunit alpha [Defluviitaleaceae bacterium]|nr:tryptophan synthase subunit alpha [Defluviitaleaceae bacterium]
MNRIANAFAASGETENKALIAFIMGGDPDIETTEKLIIAMEQAGVDLFEIGIPFSDPAADGLVIQQASVRALEKGCTADDLLNMVQRLRSGENAAKKITAPITFLTYANSIFAYGKERFMERCRDCGVDGVIVPDIPYEEKEELADVCEKYGIAHISMVAPTSKERTETIAREAEGFLYCVSTLGVTGIREKIRTNVQETIEKVRAVSDIPCAVGFGISTPEQARDMASVSDGVIIGTAIVKIIGEYGRESVEPVRQYVARIKDALS